MLLPSSKYTVWWPFKDIRDFTALHCQALGVAGLSPAFSDAIMLWSYFPDFILNSPLTYRLPHALLTFQWYCISNMPPKSVHNTVWLVFTFRAAERISSDTWVVSWIELAESSTFWSCLFKPQKPVKAFLSMVLGSQDDAGLTVPGI